MSFFHYFTFAFVLEFDRDKYRFCVIKVSRKSQKEFPYGCHMCKKQKQTFTQNGLVQIWTLSTDHRSIDGPSMVYVDPKYVPNFF